MQLSLTLHFLTNIKITIARRQEWRHLHWNPRHTNWRAFNEKLDNFAYAISIGINNFAFTHGQEPSPYPRPMIEVDAQLQSWWMRKWGDQGISANGWMTSG